MGPCFSHVVPGAIECMKCEGDSTAQHDTCKWTARCKRCGGEYRSSVDIHTAMECNPSSRSCCAHRFDASCQRCVLVWGSSPIATHAAWFGQFGVVCQHVDVHLQRIRFQTRGVVVICLVRAGVACELAGTGIGDGVGAGLDPWRAWACLHTQNCASMLDFPVHECSPSRSFTGIRVAWQECRLSAQTAMLCARSPRALALWCRWPALSAPNACAQP